MSSNDLELHELKRWKEELEQEIHEIEKELEEAEENIRRVRYRVYAAESAFNGKHDDIKEKYLDPLSETLSELKAEYDVNEAEKTKTLGTIKKMLSKIETSIRVREVFPLNK